MTDLRRQLDALSRRGPHADPDQVIAAALAAAATTPDATTPDTTTPDAPGSDTLTGPSDPPDQEASIMHLSQLRRQDRRRRTVIIAAVAATVGLLVGGVAVWRIAGDGTDLTTDPADSVPGPATTDGTPGTTEGTSATTAGPADTGTGSTATGTSGTTPAGPVPDSLWIIDGTTYDAVQIELATGRELDRVAGWGAEAASPDQEIGPQVLEAVELGPDGRLWLQDCCEPAVGTTFVLDPATIDGISDAPMRFDGLGAEVSPDGRLVALTISDFGVTVADAATGEQLVAPEVIGELAVQFEPPFPGPDTTTAGITRPLSWMTATVLAVSVSYGDQTVITFIDLTDPTRPVVPAADDWATDLTLRGDVIDADVAPDGTITALLVPTAGGNERRLVSIDPASPAFEELGPVPAGTVAVVYAAGTSGAYLLPNENGEVVIYSPGAEPRTLDLDAIAAAW